MIANDGGKGSAPRPLSVDNQTFSDNFERIFGRKPRQVRCEACHGYGSINMGRYDHRCTKCEGKGWIDAELTA